MVLKGQFLERSTLIPVGPSVLEALWHRGERSPSLLILSPLPAEGGSMDHVLSAELAWAVSQAGHATLRFNYRGVGASQGARGGAGECLEDATAAFQTLVEDTEGRPVAVASIAASQEVLLALRPDDALLRGAAFVAPRHLDRSALARFQVPVLLIEQVGDLPAVGRTVAAWLQGL
jgi:uncharacterized protein